MDTNGFVSGGGAGGRVGSSAFWSGVSGVLGGLDWASMSLGVREGWLSVLSNVEGAVAACRAAGVACGGDTVGTAERTAELVRATGMSGRDAAGVVKAADVLVAAPAVAEALATGAITTGHVDAIVRDLPAGHRLAAVADPAVLDAAVSKGVDGFKAGMRDWQAHQDCDLDGARLAARQHARRRACVTTGADGMMHFRADLAPDAGAVVATALHGISEKLWRTEDDRAPDPTDPARGRSVAQRNADAFKHMAELANNGGTPGPARVDLQVVVDYQVLAGTVTGSGRCETSDGVVLTAAVVRRLACDTGVIPTVMGADSQVLDQGRRTRTVSSAQRRALIVRDGGCVFPGCDRPASWCDAHHIIHWLNHGRTDLENLALLCTAHHRCVHEGGWNLTHVGGSAEAAGKLVFTDPAGRTLAAEPPTARFRNFRGSGNSRGHAEQGGGAGRLQGPTTPTTGNADGTGNGHGHIHEQGQLVPARKQVVQRR